MARLLTIMGSGETAPTMIKVHRQLMERAGATSPGSAVLLDTPYGFQENAGDISDKAREYFRQSVGHPIEVTSWRAGVAHALDRERAIAAVADARYVFAGPGSPTYALGQWQGTALPQLLAEKLEKGGAVTFASAAALTLGVVAVPVYEVYKVGVDPFWAPALDLLSAIGLPVAVIPHYDNAEGGGHDTRYCYLGERRLSALEPELPEGAWVLGVDEHTALVLDLDAGTASIEGHGTVTVRSGGESEVMETGETFPLDALRPGSGRGTIVDQADTAPVPGAEPVANAGLGLSNTIEEVTAGFDRALAERDADTAVRCILDLEQAMVDWSADTLQSDEVDRARAALRRMVVRLGEVAIAGLRDPRKVVGPFVEAVLTARVDARGSGAYDLADQLRDALIAAGVEVRDTGAGAEWHLTTDGAAGERTT